MTKHFLHDTTTLLGRSLLHILRSPDTIITTAITPIAMLLMFVYVFGGAIDTGGANYERFQSMPIARSAVLWGHVITSVIANLVSLVLVILVAVAIGFRSGAGVVAWLEVLGIMVLFTLALTWLAVSAGLVAKSPDGAGAFAYPLLFLPFVSSAFVPTDGMPGPVKWFAEHQPVTSIVNTLRNLYADTPLGNEVWTALAWCVGLLVVAYALGVRMYHRKLA